MQVLVDADACPTVVKDIDIGERLRMRGVMEQLRATGIDTRGPAPYDARDSKTFAGQFDRFLARHAAQPRKGD